MLTPYDWIYGIATITAVALSIIAGIIAFQCMETTNHSSSIIRI